VEFRLVPGLLCHSGDVQIAILGPVEVHDGGRRADVAGTRVRRLLTRLAVDAGRVVSVDELALAVWPDDPPGNVVNALQTLVSRLRRALGDADVILQEFGGYRLVVAPLDVDVARFSDAARRGRAALDQGRPEQAATLLDDALSLWRGDALHDAGDAEYAASLVERWGSERLDATADRIEADLDLGRCRDRVVDLEALATAHPLRERFTGLLVRALADDGRTAEALVAYERLRSRLADELGADPSPRLQAQYLELLRAEVPEHRIRPASATTNVPTPLTRVIGRSDEVKRISSLLESSRLVSIVGPGGAGKTRLATELADMSREHHRDGVWLVQLAPVSEESGVVRAMAEPLGRFDSHVLDLPNERSSADPVERLVERLQGLDTLLVVDNCEHVIAWTAALLDTLLAACPRLRVLTTSREPLGIAGEALCVLAPLSMPAAGCSVEEASAEPSVQLFVERAEAVDADFVLDEASVVSVVEIVRRLDGLPLAIELAAARLRVMPVPEVARRLTDRFRLLTGGSRTAMPRHRTLRAVVDWSWSLLSEPERLLAERLSVFPSGATASSAEAVCADERLPAQAIPELLDSLVEKSLLKVAEEGGLRYRMLETIREYGVERLAAREEVVAARTAHARHFAALTARVEPDLRSARQLAALQTLNLERDNVLAALRFLGDSGDANATLAMAWSLCWYWAMVGAHGEAAWWLRFALDVPLPDGADDREVECLRLSIETVLLLSILAEGDSPNGPVDAGTVEATRDRASRLEVALDEFEITDPPLIAIRPMVAYFSGNVERSRELSARALASPDRWTRAATRTFRAIIAENEGDVDAMRHDLDASVDDLRKLGDRWLLGSSLACRARIRTLDGDLERAVGDFEQAGAALREIGSLDDQYFVGLRLADLYVRIGDLDKARSQLSTIFRGGSSPWAPLDMFETAMELAIARLQDDVDESDRLAATLRSGISRLPDLSPLHGHLRAVFMSNLAAYDIWRGRVESSEPLLVQAYQAAVPTRDMPIVAVVGVALAAFAEALGDHSNAAEILGAAAALRGSGDESDLEISRVTSMLRSALGADFDVAYGRGRAMTRDAALARLDPARYRSGALTAG
jgi:predicted ATPase/DNA-binding SARP family transcriptional activator